MLDWSRLLVGGLPGLDSWLVGLDHGGLLVGCGGLPHCHWGRGWGYIGGVGGRVSVGWLRVGVAHCWFSFLVSSFVGATRWAPQFLVLLCCHVTTWGSGCGLRLDLLHGRDTSTVIA